MKKITKNAIECFLAHEFFSLDNTRVEILENPERAVLKLWGNVIAVRYKTTGDTEITTAGWNTLTTRSRLNGIPGVSVCTQAGQLYLNGVAWSGDWKTLGLLNKLTQ